MVAGSFPRCRFAGFFNVTVLEPRARVAAKASFHDDLTPLSSPSSSIADLRLSHLSLHESLFFSLSKGSSRARQLERPLRERPARLTRMEAAGRGDRLAAVFSITDSQLECR